MRTLADRLIRIFISLKLTVTLLAFAILLVFIGTLAQVNEGLYNAQSHYFRQWLIFGLDLFGISNPAPASGRLSHRYAAPAQSRRGASLSLSTLDQKNWHPAYPSGVILLLVGQLATDMLAHESQMHFVEGETKPYAESGRNYELVFTRDTGTGDEEVIAIPGRLLAKSSAIRNENLPFTIRVKTYWENSEPSFRAPMMKNGPPLTTNGVGASFDFASSPETKSMDEKNVPTALIQIISTNGSLGDWIVSDWTSDDEMVEGLQQGYQQQLGPEMAKKIAAQLTQPQVIETGGKKYTFALRPERVYFPFSLKLLKATHTVYAGTDIPKDFRSRVQLTNPQTGENREVEISMNHPLRYAGLTFYQYQMDAGQAAREAGARGVVGVASRA